MRHSLTDTLSVSSEKKLWITRPKEDAVDFAKALETIGVSSIIHPLLSVKQTPGVLHAINLKDYDYILLTSINALRTLKESGVALSRPLFVVGKRLAESAKDLGVQHVIYCGKTAKEMEEYVQAHIDKEKSSFLYLSPQEPSEDIVGSLKEKGYTIASQVVYRTEAVEVLPTAILEQIGQGNLCGIVFFSIKTAKVFLALLEQYQQCYSAKSLNLFCFSENIAQVFHQYGKEKFQKIRVAKQPNRESMLALIREFKFTD